MGVSKSEAGFHERPIAVLGGGNSAFATAAALALAGHQVSLFEAPECSESVRPIQTNRRITLDASGIDGAPHGTAQLDVVTTEPEEALVGAEVVFFVVPAFAEERFTELCLPFVNPAQLIVFFCGNLGSALAFAHRALQAGERALPMIVETDGLYYGGFKSDERGVRLTGLKAGLCAAAFPAPQTDNALERLNEIFPGYTFGRARNVIETGMRNMNPMLHPAISILNAGRTTPDGEPFLYYKEGVTPAVAAVIKAVDNERLSVGTALGFELRSLYDVILNWYGWQGARGEGLYELLTTNPAYQTARAPKTLDHRFISEDLPYGLVPLSELGKATGTPTPAIDALIMIAGLLLGTDMRRSGRHLESLGLAGQGSQALISYVEGAS